MSMRTDKKAHPAKSVPGIPKSFAPQDASPAWESLRSLSNKEEGEVAGPEDLIALARSTFRARRIRGQHFPEPMFGEPAWDMLLALFVRARSGARQSITRLTKFSGAPPTTALRWIDFLERMEFVSRRTSPTDKRIALIELTDKGREAIEAYLADLVQQGLITPMRS